LAYSLDETENSCGTNISSFIFHFMNDPWFEKSEKFPEDPTFDLQTTEFVDKALEKITSPVDVQAIAVLGDVGDGEIPCDIAQGPGLYGVITYNAPISTKTFPVYFYSNKIPRIGGDLIYNPAAIIHGNVYAQTSFTPSAGVESVQTAGNVNINIVRDTIYENLTKEVRDFSLTGGAGCTIKNLDLFDRTCSSSSAVVFDVGDEKVFYSKGRDVHLGQPGEVLQFVGQRVIVVDGGNLFIDAGVYNTDLQKLTIVVLRGHDEDYADAGNIYIHPDVKNIQANIVADGSIFSYSGDTKDINSDTAEPKWASSSVMVDTLKNQLFIQGSISSRNTIGGADLDAPRSMEFGEIKPYLLLGTGETVGIDEKARAQLYDLNYFRLFEQSIQRVNGLPVDQQCKKPLTSEDLLDILNGVQVLGENSLPCNGINPLLGEDQGGDLVPPDDPTIIAEGLSGTDFGPIYVFYVAPSTDSFVFAKPGAININQ